jgi:hypothetical protein
MDIGSADEARSERLASFSSTDFTDVSRRPFEIRLPPADKRPGSSAQPVSGSSTP